VRLFPLSPLLAHTYKRDRRKSFISTHIANDPQGWGYAKFAEIDRKLLKRGNFHAGIKVMLSCMIGIGVTYWTGNHLLNKTPGDDHLRGFLIIRFKLSARNSRPGLPMRSRNKRNSPNPHPVSCGTRGKSASTPRHKTGKM